MGNEPLGLAAGDGILAGTHIGGACWLACLGRVRGIVGTHCTKWDFPALISTGCGLVGVVRPGEAWEEFVGRRGAGIAYLFCVHCAVAAAQLPDIREVHLYSRQFWSGASVGEWKRCGRDFNVVFGSAA